MIEVRQTTTFSGWLDGLKDRRAKAAELDQDKEKENKNGDRDRTV